MAQRRFALINKQAEGLTQKVKNTSYTIVGADAGTLISKQSGGAGETFTIPANTASSTASFDSGAFDTAAFNSDVMLFSGATTSDIFSIGTMIAIDNSGGGDITIGIDTDTLTWANDGSSGNRTLADGGIAVLLKVNDTEWKIAGEGLS